MPIMMPRSSSDLQYLNTCIYISSPKLPLSPTNPLNTINNVVSMLHSSPPYASKITLEDISSCFPPPTNF